MHFREPVAWVLSVWRCWRCRCCRLSAKTIDLIQTGLAELGYDPGLVDGKMGEKTKQAIRDFQRDRSLQPTGVATSELLNELRKVTGLTSLSES